MTDKQIIDGVDVSGCAYITYRDSENPICSETGQYCKGYDICYFKQLKRKEQECEELKKKCNIYTYGICGNKEDCNKLYKTITEIKEIAENMNTECFYDDFDCKDCDMKNGCIFLGKLKILQKMSECEENNDMENN